MTRLLIVLVPLLFMPIAAWGQEVGFTNLGGPSACLRSMAYRAGYKATADANCPRVWIASLRLCRTYKAPDRFAYRLAFLGWKFQEFVADAGRKDRGQCGEGARLAELARLERERRDAGPEAASVDKPDPK